MTALGFNNWRPNAAEVAGRKTITVTGTWAAGETATVVINGKDLVVTMGTGMTSSADAANAIYNMLTGVSPYLTETRTAIGSKLGELYNVTFSISAAVITVVGDPGYPLPIASVADSAAAGAVALATVTTETGSRWANNADNWTGGLPAIGHNVRFDQGNVPCSYGLTQLADCQQIHIRGGWSGWLGLPDINRRAVNGGREPYMEGQPTHVVRTAACDLRIGEGDGPLPALVRIDFDGQAGPIRMERTGSRIGNSPHAAVEILGAATTTITIRRGDVELAGGTGNTLHVGMKEESSSDARVINRDATTELKVLGGYVEDHGNATSTIQYSGTLQKIAGSSTTLRVRGGKYFWKSTAAHTTVHLSDRGVIDCSGDGRAKVLGNPLELYGTLCRFHDPDGTIPDAESFDLNEGARASQIDCGTNRRLTLAAIA